jgi:DNA-binding NtrC family response regulator
MTETTLTRDSEELDGNAAGRRLHSCVIFIGHLDRPDEVPSAHALDDLDEVRFHRGARRVERRGGVLELAFPDERMSNPHGRWVLRGAQWIAEDLGSKNGTIVDGGLAASAALHDGAVVELGHSFFLFRRSFVEAIPPHLAADVDANHLPAWPPGLRTFAPDLARAFEGLVRIAGSSESVLLVGETGTGKEIAARAVHELSARRGDLVAVNCGALPATLVEAELFGHRRNAFTGATTTRLGLVRSADRGTLFLDEIGELAPTAQAALLRVLQEREVLPLGEDRPVAVDLRLIAATLRDLEADMHGNRFRRDLYARLAGHVVSLPALRDRREDLGLLISKMRAEHRPVRLAPAALRALLRHDWPYNIRELEQALSTAISLAPGDTVKLEHLPAAVRGGRTRAVTEPPPRPPPAPAPERALALDDEDRALRARLLELISRHEGNVSAVAEATGKKRSQIYKWVKRLGIDLAAFRRSP